VNTPTPYEQLMAAKLDQVPVPDMADGIWSSIGMQLDTGAPDQVDNAPDEKSTPKFNGKGWYGALGVVAMVVATLWWYYSHTAGNTTRQVMPPVMKEPAARARPVADTVEKRIDVPTTPAGVKKDTVVVHKVPGAIVRPDSAASQQALPPVKVDSPSLFNDWIAVPFFDSLSLKPSGRKSKGVKGITSDDYKISAEKHHQ